MTIKLNSLDRWKTLEANASINFEGAEDAERRVRLKVNCEEETSFYYEDANGPRFLTGVGMGVTEIEFGATGKFSVFPHEGAGVVQYQTAEHEPTFAVIFDPVIFTKIANRRHRNPEIEQMMFMMNQNIERRLAAQKHEFEAALERRRNEEINGRPVERVETIAPGAAANSGSEEVSTQEPSEPGAGKVDGSADAGEPESH